LLLDTHRPQAFALVSFDPPPRRDRAAAPVMPPRPCAALRIFRPPWRVTVTLRDGAPAFVAGAVRGPVRDHAGPWRASGDWWDEAWSREEWDVALASGGVYRLFLDRLRGEWFVEGEVD
jgi:protein ImuB